MNGWYTGFAVLAAGLAGVLFGVLLGWAAGWAQRIEEYNKGFDAGYEYGNEERLDLKTTIQALEDDLRIKEDAAKELVWRLSNEYTRKACGSYETESRTEVKDDGSAEFKNKRTHHQGFWREWKQKKH